MRSWWVLVILIFLGSAQALAAGGQPPSDFRGVKWGAKPTTAMKKIGGPFPPENLSVWKNTAKSLPSYLNIPVSEESYLFENDRLYGGQLFIDGAQNFTKARDALIGQYGQPDFKNEKLQLFKWKWSAHKIEISISYQSNFQRTTLGITKQK